MLFVFDDFLDQLSCSDYKSIIEKHYKQSIIDKTLSKTDIWDGRTVRLDLKDPIVKKTKRFLESRIKVKLTIHDIELQCWHQGTISYLHKHVADVRRMTDYTSMIYLNQDFIGGEFYTGSEITIKPKIGRLTFFNGKTFHGINRVEEGDRYTIILWWTNTKFL